MGRSPILGVPSSTMRQPWETAWSRAKRRTSAPTPELRLSVGLYVHFLEYGMAAGGAHGMDEGGGAGGNGAAVDFAEGNEPVVASGDQSLENRGHRLGGRWSAAEFDQKGADEANRLIAVVDGGKPDVHHNPVFPVNENRGAGPRYQKAERPMSSETAPTCRAKDGTSHFPTTAG